MPTQETKPGSNGGVHDYLINNAREALKKGDKSAAKSCLLTARYLSINDSDVTYEIYQMAKSEGDVLEASKCFTNIFLDQSANTPKVVSKSKKLILEETHLIIYELLHKHLKIKSVLNLPPASIKGPLLSSSTISAKRQSSSDTLVIHDQDSEDKFYSQLYETLNQDIQKQVLTQTIKDSESKLEQCRLMLLFLVLFPNDESSEDHGSKLLETLLEMSTKLCKGQDSRSQSLMSIYYSRGLLISDAVPLILKNTQPDKIKSRIDDIILRIFSFYLDFCISSCSTERHVHKMLDGHHDGFSKQTSASSSDRTTEKEHKIEVQFRSALHSIAKMMDWDLFSNYSDVDTSTNKLDYTERLSEISNFMSKTGVHSSQESKESQVPNPKYRGRFKKMAAAPAKEDNSPEHDSNVKQLFYSLVELLFLSLTQYLRLTRKYILTEGYVITNMEELSESDRMVDTMEDENVPGIPNSLKGTRSLQMDGTVAWPTDVLLRQSFSTAVRCYEKLNSEMKSLWEPFANSLGLTGYYGWQRRFLVDYNIYISESGASSDARDKSHYEEAMKCIKVECKETNPYIGASDLEAVKLRASIQLTCCAFRLHNTALALDNLSSLVKDIKTFHILTTNELDESYTNQQVLNYDDERNSRGPIKIVDNTSYFVYVAFNSRSFLSYCTSVICQILERETFTSKPIDLGLGHLIVLSQYEWPKSSGLFRDCVNLIRKHKPKTATPQSISPATKFTYHPFFNYIYNPCIIEEFMALLQQGYTLDIKSSGHIQTGVSEQTQSQPIPALPSTKSQQTSPASSGSQGGSSSAKAITTRGVNKSFKEDMKSALVCQMKRSNVTLNVILFIDFILEEVLPYLKERLDSTKSKGNTKKYIEPSPRIYRSPADKA